MSSTYTGLENYANYHTFSKLQVGNKVNFGGAINRSGHTVTNTDAWLDDVPFYRAFTTPTAILESVGSALVKNDLVEVTVSEGDITTGLYRRNDVAWSDTAAFTDLFASYTIGDDTKDGATVLLNKNDKAVVRVWSNQALTFLDADNNAKADSEGQAARIIINGAPVEQFIAQPDVCRSGYPSGGYAIEVKRAGSKLTLDFGTVANTFFDVPFAGTIMFGGGTDPAQAHTISCFEYIGDKLAAVNTKIAEIQETIENLTVEAGEGIKQIKPAAGSGITVATEGVEGATALTPVIGIDTTVIATKASVDAVAEDISEIQQTIESGVVSNVTASENAEQHGITVNTDGTNREIDIEPIINSDSLEGSNYLATGIAVHNAIRNAVNETILKSKVTVAKGTGVNVTTSEDGLTYTVAVDNTVATAQSVTDLAGRVTTAEGEIDALQEAVNGLTSGENSVDSKITAAKTEITGTEITEQSVSGAGITVTLDGTVGEPTLTGSVTTASYTPATEGVKGSWSDDDKVAKASDVKAAIADVETAHGKDIQTLQTAVNSLTTTGLTREVLPDGQTTADITDPKENVIYLVKDTASEAGSYIEYLHVGTGFEAIGSTKTDLSEYAKTADVNASFATTNAEVAKKANSADVYTKTDIDGKVTTINSAVEAAAAKGQQGIDDAATAKAAADAAQADATQALTNAATAKSAADAAQAAADAAQGEVDDLEGVVSALSQVVTDNKTATDAAIALKADQTALDATNTTVAGHTTAIETLNGTTIPDITERLDAIEAIPTVEVVASTAADQYITVESETKDGKTTYTVGTTGALETRLDTLESFLGSTDDPDTPNLSEILATKVDNVTGGSNGITITTTDTTDARVATLAVTADTTVTENSTNVVTSGAVWTAISNSAGTTLGSAKSYTEEQIGALKTAATGTITAANTAISVTQTDAKVTAIEVTKGEIADKNTNLVDGGTVYAVTSTIETRLSKVETAADTGVDSKITTAIEALDATLSGNGITVTQVDGVITAVAAATGTVAENNTDVVTGGVVHAAITKAISDQAAIDATTYAAKDTETTAANALRAADGALLAANSKVESISSSDDRVKVTTVPPVTNPSTITVQIALAETVATVDGADDTAGTVYTKAQVDEMVGGAKPENYVTTVKVGENETSGEVTVEVEAKTEATHFGSELISASLTGSKVTINAAPAKEWSVSDVTESIPSIASITSVINGKMSNGSTIDDANLIDGTAMFAAFTALTTYVGDLGKLTIGSGMFAGCTALTTFVGNLSSLTNGIDMFSGCALDKESLIYIVESLPEVESGAITVGVATGVDKAPYVTEAAAKGWTLV